MNADFRLRLTLVKLVHTIVWVLFATAILAMPVAAWYGRFSWFFVLTAIVLVEVAVLALNRMRSPLTDVATRYTDDRRDNFDIYLPLFVARYNKQIFGSLFVLGLLFGLYRVLV